MESYGFKNFNAYAVHIEMYIWICWVVFVSFIFFFCVSCTEIYHAWNLFFFLQKLSLCCSAICSCRCIFLHIFFCFCCCCYFAIYLLIGRKQIHLVFCHRFNRIGHKYCVIFLYIYSFFSFVVNVSAKSAFSKIFSLKFRIHSLYERTRSFYRISWIYVRI